jgi:hypothetical protein
MHRWHNHRYKKEDRGRVLPEFHRNQHDGFLEIEGLDLPRVHFGDPEDLRLNLLAQKDHAC